MPASRSKSGRHRRLRVSSVDRCQSRRRTHNSQSHRRSLHSLLPRPPSSRQRHTDGRAQRGRVQHVAPHTATSIRTETVPSLCIHRRPPGCWCRGVRQCHTKCPRKAQPWCSWLLHTNRRDNWFLWYVPIPHIFLDIHSHRNALLTGAMGAVFALTESVVANTREKDDALNGVAGGCAAGFLAGIRGASVPVRAGTAPFSHIYLLQLVRCLWRSRRARFWAQQLAPLTMEERTLQVAMSPAHQRRWRRSGNDFSSIPSRHHSSHHHRQRQSKLSVASNISFVVSVLISTLFKL